MSGRQTRHQKDELNFHSLSHEAFIQVLKNRKRCKAQLNTENEITTS